MTDRVPLPRPAGADDDIGRPPIRCEWCHEPFRPAKPLGRMPKYCRQSCRQRAFEARKEEGVLRDVLALHGVETDPGKPVPRTPVDSGRRRRKPRDGASSGPAPLAGGAENVPLFDIEEDR